MGGPGSISGTVWKDLNANGAHDASDHGLANAEVRLTCVGCPGAGTPAFTQTDSGGNDSFGSLASATYSVEIAKVFPANPGIPSSGGWTPPPVSGTWAAIQIVLGGGEDRAGEDSGWRYLTLLRPASQLLPTPQVFHALPSLQPYRVSTATATPRFYILPTASQRPIYILPTKTPVPFQPPSTPIILPPIKPG